MANPASEADTAARLIEKAIRALSPGEQARVVRYLIRSWLELRRVAQPPALLYEALYKAVPPGLGLGGRTASLSTGSELQTLPVRLPEEQHTRLKEWCAQQGFSMATVIRGLVENFLEAQGRGTSERQG